MKVYITSRFRDFDKERNDSLREAVRSAGAEDFSFIRDVENYEPIFVGKPVELWERSREELRKCGALLIDVTDEPSGGRVLEAGMAFAMGLPIFVIMKTGTKYKDIYKGIATKVIEYDTFEDLIEPIKEFTRTS